jgi:hypothetical protein
MIQAGSRPGGRERRRHRRGYQSCRVTYGLEAPEHRATARRLSAAGLFIATNKVVFAAGVTVVMDLEIGGRLYRVSGVVRHALKIDPRLTRVMKPGMGIAFLEAGEDLKWAIETNK